jgi:alpha-tubulin suppressor-like RCC1 family protein
MIGCGIDHTVALLNDGRVVTFGSNGGGQRGRQGLAFEPGFVDGITQATQIAAGGGHTVVLRDDGTIWTFGNNGYGQLGRSTTSGNNPVAEPIEGLTGVAVTAGAQYTMVLSSDGEVWTFGDNLEGQLGRATVNRIDAKPKRIDMAVAARGIAGGGSHSIVCGSDGTIWTFGNNHLGKLGRETSERNDPIARVVPELTDATFVAAGGGHSVIVCSNHQVWTFGNNSQGQLGRNGSPKGSFRPELVHDLTAISASAGSSWTMVLRPDASVWTFGGNGFGQLGRETIASTSNPLPGAQAKPLIFPSAVTAISAGNLHSAVLCADGGLWTFGNNDYGQLGRPTTLDVPNPTPRLAIHP